MIWEYLIKNDNNITNFHFEISADILDEEMLSILKKARKGLFQFEVGVQSTNYNILNEIKRKTNLEKLFEKVKIVKNFGNIHQHLDLIAGLPNENYEAFKTSFNDVFSVYPEQFQVGFLKLLKGSGLRINSQKYGIIFKEKAPYEVLFTKDITYNQMCNLKGIEELVEIYYNSGKAINTIKYSMNFFDSYFDFFEKFNFYWQKNHLHKISHNKMETYKIFFEFLSNETNCDLKILKEILKFDIFLNDNIKTLPNWLENEENNNFKEIEKAFYSNQNNINKYLPHFKEKNSKQLSKICHFYKFNINLEIAIKTEFKKIKENHTFVLFDYYTKNDLVYKVTKHFLKEGDFK